MHYPSSQRDAFRECRAKVASRTGINSVDAFGNPEFWNFRLETFAKNTKLSLDLCQRFLVIRNRQLRSIKRLPKSKSRRAETFGLRPLTLPWRPLPSASRRNHEQVRSDGDGPRRGRKGWLPGLVPLLADLSRLRSDRYLTSSVV